MVREFDNKEVRIKKGVGEGGGVIYIVSVLHEDCVYGCYWG